MRIPLSTLIVLNLIFVAPGAIAAKKDASDVKSKTPTLPGLKIDMKKRIIDAKGVICFREGVLELIATNRGGKDHESIVRLDSRPQHLHLALILIKVKQGTPGKWIYKDRKPIPIDPTGGRVAISMIYEKDGKRTEKPINYFVRNIQSKKPMAGNIFLFAGSVMHKTRKGKSYYAANSSGDVISLVSFGDEVLALPKAASANNGEITLEANPDTIPKLNTPVTIRIKALDSAKPAAKKEDKKSDQPSGKSDKKPSGGK